MDEEIDEKKLTEYVTVLNELPDEIKNNAVDMRSNARPECGTPGCHAGLVSIVAKYLPELQEHYDRSVKREGISKDYYYFTHWADALAMYLGFQFHVNYEPRHKLTQWAKDNHYIWDNPYGSEMFLSGRAFGQRSDNFPHSVIIQHFTIMSDRLNKKLEQKM